MTHRIGPVVIDLCAWRCERAARSRAAFEAEIDALLAFAARTRSYCAPKDNVVKLNVRKNNG